MKRIILFGAPGSGKGTQADKIEKEFSYKKISTGDLIRVEVQNRSVIGLKIEEYTARGSLVPDEIIIEMVKERVNRDDISNGYILDGFPRTLDQVKGLSGIKTDEEVAIFLKVNEDILVKRILSRLYCKKCGNVYNVISRPPKQDNICDKCGGPLTRRNDDTEEILKKRIQVYRQETLPVIEYYRGKGNLYELDASGEIGDVWKEIREIVN